jgi:hypothetical protein
MDYKLTTNDPWMNSELMDGNPCEWTPLIIGSCSMLMFVTLSTFAICNVYFEFCINGLSKLWMQPISH